VFFNGKKMFEINEVEVEHFYRPTWPTIRACKVNVERALVILLSFYARTFSASKVNVSPAKHYAPANYLGQELQLRSCFSAAGEGGGGRLDH
jgi:hypothetical protein